MNKKLFCTFGCNKSMNEVNILIAGFDSFICNECIILCNEIIYENYTKRIEMLKSFEVAGYF